MQFNYLFKDQSVREPTDQERNEACRTLWLEYRGSGTTIDSQNINDVAKGLNKKRLTQFSLYMNVVKPIIDRENTTYINPPTRTFVRGGKPVSARMQDYISQMLEDIHYDIHFQKYEVSAALLGTVLVRPTHNPADNSISLVDLTPAITSLKVTPDPFDHAKAMEVEYMPTQSAKLIYDYENVTTIKTGENGQEITTVEPHGFNGQPFAVLNFFPDTQTFYGPFDGTLYSFTKQRSMVLANTVAAMHLSEAEKLVMTGFTWEDALNAIRERMIVAPNDKTDTSGNHIDQSVDILRPTGDEALNLLKTYLELYKHLLDVRGHAPRQFSVGADAMSAEAVRLGGIDMRQVNQRKKMILTYFEKQLFKRLIWINNSIPGRTTIPDDVEVQVDFKPDPLYFNSASDETLFFRETIAKDVNTPIDWIRSRQPELSEDEAIQAYQDNIKFNSENGVHTSPIANPTDPNTNDNSSLPAIEDGSNV